MTECPEPQQWLKEISTNVTHGRTTTNFSVKTNCQGYTSLGYRANCHE